MIDRKKAICRRMRLVAPVLAAGLLLGACQTTGPNQTAGTLLGAATGGFIGSRFGGGTGQLAATALGTVVGAGVGSGIGADLDRGRTYYVPRSRVVERHYYYDRKHYWHPPRHRHYRHHYHYHPRHRHW